MNKFTKIIATATLTIGFIGMASASNEIVPADDYVTSKLCAVATEGNAMKLSKAIKKAGLNKRFVVNNVTCNNQELTTFVEQYGTNVDDINNFLLGGKYISSAETVASL